MPDIWELAHNLNPLVADNNGDYENNGYTNLEKYLNELAAFPADGPLIFKGSTNRFALIGNWGSGVFLPSRYDLAQINSGTAVVDCIGEHAGTLKIATNAGNSAALSVTDGWIDIAQTLSVGPAGTGQVNQTGGIVHANTSVILGSSTSTGTYTLSAGTLSTPTLSNTGTNSTFNDIGGTLHANDILFDLTNNGGTLAPGSDANLELMAAAAMPDLTNITAPAGDNIGTTHIHGNLTLATGDLQIEIASLLSDDTVNVDGIATLGGELDIDPIAGFTPSPGDSWEIMTAGSFTGSFAEITPGYAVQQVGNALFVVVPEPGSLSLIGLSGIFLFRPRKRRNFC